MSSLSVRTNPLGESTKENLRPKQNKVGTSKRSALGNVTNQVRIQPVRAAKDKHSVLQGLKANGQENVECGVQKKASSAGQPFSIFQDISQERKPKPLTCRVPPIVHEEPMIDQENLLPLDQDLMLNEAVIGLNHSKSRKNLAPLAPLHINIEPLDDSPMAIDSPCHSERSPEKHDQYGLDPYYDDIYNYLRSIEGASRPRKSYMSLQNDVTTSMRNILVDWLVEVGEEYKLNRETLFLAIAFIDKFLSLVVVQRPKLQLVGTAAMFIAAKYEEIYPPDVGEFVYITDDTYTRNQVLKMEGVILKVLGFKVAVPTINWFCERFMAAVDMNDKAKNLAHYLTELSLIEVEEFLQFPPSVLAASAVCLARSTAGLSEAWPKELIAVTKYSLSDLRPCMSSLHSLHCSARNMPQQAVIEKYKQQRYNQVSLLTPDAPISLDL